MRHLHKLLLDSYTVVLQCCREVVLQGCRQVVLQCHKEVELHTHLELPDNQHLIEDMMWVAAVQGILAEGDTLAVVGTVEAVHLVMKG